METIIAILMAILLAFGGVESSTNLDGTGNVESTVNVDLSLGVVLGGGSEVAP